MTDINFFDVAFSPFLASECHRDKRTVTQKIVDAERTLLGQAGTDAANAWREPMPITSSARRSQGR